MFCGIESFSISTSMRLGWFHTDNSTSWIKNKCSRWTINIQKNVLCGKLNTSSWLFPLFCHLSVLFVYWLNCVFFQTGYGFVDFESPTVAQKAVTALKNKGIQAQMAKVSKCHFTLSSSLPVHILCGAVGHFVVRIHAVLQLNT